ncbi:hypothetical protein [Streptomyces sp. KS 21]|uniref:hypothetical protein n=1 Tax=Streptomyces sp. KS 21 TaxID=2485150 RepID=UPI001063433B|nr:hypothetical protein [Streptomyces sp. KS 21]
MAVHNGTLYCTHVGATGEVWLAAFTGTGWASPIKFGGWRAGSGAALASHDGKLYCAHRGMDDKIYLASSANATSWGGASSISGWLTYDAPSLTSFDGKLHCAYRDRSGTLYVAAQTGTTWSATQVQTGGYGTPSLAAHRGNLYALYV